MQKVITYIADDGKKFSDEYECAEYELQCKNKHSDAIRQEMKDLDTKLWQKYYPDDKNTNEPTLFQADIWLSADITQILYDFPDSKEDVLSVIHKSEYGDEILKKYLDMDAILNEVSIRKDFASALRSVRKGYDLSPNIHYSFSKQDIAELAKLHKANRFEKKIEDLLTDCNFHYECGKFINGEYDEFLNE